MPQRKKKTKQLNAHKPAMFVSYVGNCPRIEIANKTKNTLIQMQNSKKTMHKTLER